MPGTGAGQANPRINQVPIDRNLLMEHYPCSGGQLFPHAAGRETVTVKLFSEMT